MATRQESFDGGDVKRNIVSPTSEDGRIVETVFNPDLKAAIENTRLDPLSRRAFALYLICMVAFMCAVSNGA